MSYIRNLVSLALLLALSSVALAQDIRPVVQVGVVVPLTGDMARHGLEVQRAMTLALEQAQTQKLAYQYRLTFEDNQLNTAKSAAAAQKLINVDHVDTVVTLWPPTATVVAPIATRAGILHYTIGWDPAFAKQNKLGLSHQAMVNNIARKTLQLLRESGKTNVAFFHLEETGFNLGAEYIRSLASSENINIVADETFLPAETDFRSLIEKAMAKKPECYLVWSVMPSIDPLIRQIRSRDKSACISGYLDYAEDSTLIQNSPYVSEMFAAPEFVEKYFAKYEENPISKGPNAYDIMNLLVRAFESSPSRRLSATELKSFLTTLRDISGAVGTFSIDSDGNSTYLPVVRETVGKERLLVSEQKD